MYTLERCRSLSDEALATIVPILQQVQTVEPETRPQFVAAMQAWLERTQPELVPRWVTANGLVM